MRENLGLVLVFSRQGRLIEVVRSALQYRPADTTDGRGCVAAGSLVLSPICEVMFARRMEERDRGDDWVRR